MTYKCLLEQGTWKVGSRSTFPLDRYSVSSAVKFDKENDLGRSDRGARWTALSSIRGYQGCRRRIDRNLRVEKWVAFLHH